MGSAGHGLSILTPRRDTAYRWSTLRAPTPAHMGYIISQEYYIVLLAPCGIVSLESRTVSLTSALARARIPSILYALVSALRQSIRSSLKFLVVTRLLFFFSHNNIISVFASISNPRRRKQDRPSTKHHRSIHGVNIPGAPKKDDKTEGRAQWISR